MLVALWVKYILRSKPLKVRWQFLYEPLVMKNPTVVKSVVQVFFICRPWILWVAIVCLLIS